MHGLFFSATFLPSSTGSAQHTLSAEQTKLGHQQLLKPGVVVLKVRKGGDADKAGLHAGDVLLHRSLAEKSGELRLPFDVAFVDIDQSGQLRPERDNELLASLLDFSANAFAKARSWREADTFYSAGTKHSKNPNHKILMFFHWADAFNARENFAKALKVYRKAEPSVQPDSLLASTLLRNMGWAAYRENDWTLAEARAKRALEIWQKLAPGCMDVANVYSLLGWVEEGRGNPDLAQEYEDRAIVALEQVAPQFTCFSRRTSWAS